MATKISKASLTGFLGGLLVVFSMVGCAGLVQQIKPAKTKSFKITGVEYDEAFSKAMRSAMEIGLVVYNSDKKGGTFIAQRGAGYIEATGLTFFLEKGDQKKHSFVLVVKSSGDRDMFIDEFVARYGNYVKITP